MDGSGNEELLIGRPEHDDPTDWSQDGRRLVYDHSADSTGWDLWYVTLQAGHKVTVYGAPQPFLRTPFNEFYGHISPDERYIAYISNESGRGEMYVQAFPGGGSKWQVSADGGSDPRWSPKGDELFYLAAQFGGSGPMMAVSVETAGGFRAEKPRKLFDLPAGVDLSWFDVSPDSKRFLAVQAAGEAGATAQTTITVVENWAREFAGRK